MSNQTSVSQPAHYEPLVKLAEVKVSTGEENEDILFQARTKAYRFAAATKEWKERGVGDTKILQDKETKKVRVLLRQEKTEKVIINHIIPPVALEPHLGSDKTWTWACMDFADEEPTVYSFALRFKSPEEASSFQKSWVVAQEANASASSSEEKKDDEVATGETAATEVSWATIFKAGSTKSLTEEQVKEFWNKYDKDGSNFVEKDEVAKLLSDLYDTLLEGVESDEDNKEEARKILKESIPAEVERVVASLDVNEDGKLSFDEFKKIEALKITKEE